MYNLVISLLITLLSLMLHIIAMSTASLYSQVLVKNPDYGIGLWQSCLGERCETTHITLRNLYPRCREITDNIKAAQIFSVLYCIVTFPLILLLFDAVCGIVGHVNRRKPALNSILAAISFVSEMVTMSIVSALQREKYCEGTTCLYDEYKLSYGWAFFFIAFMFSFATLCLNIRVYLHAAPW